MQFQFNENIFHNNIHLWSLAYPKDAFRLQYFHGNSIHFFVSDSGDLNFKKKIDDNEWIYHDLQDPKQEANNWFHSLNLKNSSILYVYGIGLGYYFESTKKWLSEDPKRCLVFLEDDLNVIHSFFQTPLATEFLSHQQTSLFYFDDLLDPEEKFDELYWDFILTQMSISALQLYAEAKEEKYCELRHKLVHDAAIKNALVDEYLHYGIAFFRNFYPNMLLLPESWKGTNLYGKFEGIPAIICGAGPSLEKNIHHLSQYTDKALIFGGGSALNALSSRGILPHFGIGIDPNPTQQYRLSSNKAYEVPLFYRNRMHYEAFRLVHGPRLYIPGSGGYEIADWFDEKFNLLEGIQWLDEGHNVVNFGLELAKYLGCNPIIFVGVDLAYTEMQSYASGIIDDTSIDKKDILDTGDFDTTALLKYDIYGKPIYTLWKWIAESEWTGEYAKANPELIIINATEGGLGMPGIPNLPLKEVADKYLIKSFDLYARVQGEIINSEFSDLTNKKILTATEDLKDSLIRSNDYIETLIEDKKIFQKKILENHTIPIFTQSGYAALAEIELEEEPAYEHILGIFNLVYSRILNKELQRALSENSNFHDWEKELEKNRVNLKRLSFMSEVAKVNIQIIEKALNERFSEIGMIE